MEVEQSEQGKSIIELDDAFLNGLGIWEVMVNTHLDEGNTNNVVTYMAFLLKFLRIVLLVGQHRRYMKHYLDITP